MSRSVKDFQPRGAAKALWLCRDRQVMLEGPAGTSKTRPMCELVHYYASNYDFTRILICRKTRASLTESVLNTYQRVTLAGHHAALGADPAHRTHYEYNNGSRVVCGGLDTPERTFSTEYNIIWVEEAAEIKEAEAEMLLRALRWHKGCKRRQIIYTTNPGDPRCWLNVRANEGKITRLLGRYEDNPRYWNIETNDWTDEGRDYVCGTLDQMTGVRYLRLRKGIWAGAEGMVYESEWDAARNVIAPDAAVLPRGEKGGVEFRYHVASVDWGFTEPGCLQVWGVDGDGRMFMVYELYRAGMGMGPNADGGDSWFAAAQRVQARYKPVAWTCDPARPEHIEQFRRHNIPAQGADNERETGIEAVRRRLRPAKDGVPRLFLLSNAQDGRDPQAVAAGRPSGAAEEITQYVYYRPPNERPSDDRTDPTCADHGMDAMRYACVWVDRYHSAPKPGPKYTPGSAGQLLGHDLLDGGLARRNGHVHW